MTDTTVSQSPPEQPASIAGDVREAFDEQLTTSERKLGDGGLVYSHAQAMRALDAALSRPPSEQPASNDAVREALEWLARQETVAEALEGGPPEWVGLSPHDRAEYLGKRKQERDDAIEAARTALTALSRRSPVAEGEEGQASGPLRERSGGHYGDQVVPSREDNL